MFEKIYYIPSSRLSPFSLDIYDVKALGELKKVFDNGQNLYNFSNFSFILCAVGCEKVNVVRLSA